MRTLNRLHSFARLLRASAPIVLAVLVLAACASGAAAPRPAAKETAAAGPAAAPAGGAAAAGATGAPGPAAATASAAAADREDAAAAPAAAKSALGAAPRDGAPAAEAFAAPSPAPAVAPAGGVPRPAAARAPDPTESGLKAGFADDNEQYNYFLGFLKDNRVDAVRNVPVEGRILVSVVDESGAPAPNAAVEFVDPSGRVRDRAVAYADGIVLFTPPVDAAAAGWKLRAGAASSYGYDFAAELGFALDGPRSLRIVLPRGRAVPDPAPLDLVFVLDTTGSMGEEIARLKATIDIIRDNMDLARPRPVLRFGLVLYKDRGDSYVVRSYPLTADLEEFRKNLAKASASGGGDEPEDLEAALAAVVGEGMGWDPRGARLAFVVTDAPAQVYPDAPGYDVAAERARALGIKIHTIGTGGLPLAGEYQLRQISQRTRGRYIFLTYGERGESAGGEIGAVSHHTGANWTADRLETIIIRFAKEELAQLTGTEPAVPSDDWFEAKPAASLAGDEVLDELFTETVNRLVDYSAAAVGAATPVAVLPAAAPPALAANAERFGSRFLQAAAAAKRFRLVERADLQAVLGEIELSLSAVADPAAAAKLGRFLGADLLVLPSLIEVAPAAGAGADDIVWELYVKLVRVDTAEILSVARARIAKGLGI